MTEEGRREVSGEVLATPSSLFMRIWSLGIMGIKSLHNYDASLPFGALGYFLSKLSHQTRRPPCRDAHYGRNELIKYTVDIHKPDGIE